jgi:hypothetical protein
MHIQRIQELFIPYSSNETLHWRSGNKRGKRKKKLIMDKPQQQQNSLNKEKYRFQKQQNAI